MLSCGLLWLHFHVLISCSILRYPLAMAPRRSNRQPGPLPVDGKFVHHDSEQRYNSALHNRKCIIERGVKILPEGQTGGRDFQRVINEINRRGWDFLFDAPAVGCVPLVREFYANMLKEGEDGVPRDKIFLRGKWIWLTSETVNAHHEVQPVEECAYTTMLNNPPDWDAVLRVIGREGAEWTYYDNDTECTTPKNILNTHLSDSARVWALIIMSRLRPCSHAHTIPKEPCLLLYCILTKQEVNVGTIISDHMRHIPTIRNSLPYPSLITAMARSAGVVIRQNEEKTHIEPLISPASINLTISRARNKAGGGASSSRGNLPTTQDESSRSRRQQASSSSQGLDIASLMARMDDLDMMVNMQMGNIYERMDRGFHHLDDMIRHGNPDAYRDYPPIFAPLSPNDEDDDAGNDEEEDEVDEEESASADEEESASDDDDLDAMEDSD